MLWAKISGNLFFKIKPYIFLANKDIYAKPIAIRFSLLFK